MNKKKRPEPKYKVGDWITNIDDSHEPPGPYKVTEIEYQAWKDGYYYYIDLPSGEVYFFTDEEVIPADYKYNEEILKNALGIND